MLKFSITTTSTNHIEYCVSANCIHSHNILRIFCHFLNLFVQFDFMVHNSEYIKTNAQWYRCLSQTINKIIIFYMEVEYFILEFHYIQFVVVNFFLFSDFCLSSSLCIQNRHENIPLIHAFVMLINLSTAYRLRVCTKFDSSSGAHI